MGPVSTAHAPPGSPGRGGGRSVFRSRPDSADRPGRLLTGIRAVGACRRPTPDRPANRTADDPALAQPAHEVERAVDEREVDVARDVDLPLVHAPPHVEVLEHRPARGRVDRAVRIVARQPDLAVQVRVLDRGVVDQRLDDRPAVAAAGMPGRSRARRAGRRSRSAGWPRAGPWRTGARRPARRPRRRAPGRR
jgi:hypothetical protein